MEPHTPNSRRKRSTVTAVMMIAALVSFAGCGAPRAKPTTATVFYPELRVGIAPNYPPLAFLQQGALAGVEVDFARKLASALGEKIVMVETPWPELIPALRDGRIDMIMSGMSITEERRQLVTFAHPYLRVGQMMLLRREDDARLRGDAVNTPATRIGFVTGTTGEAYVRQHLPAASHRGFESVDAAVEALRARQIDIFVHDAPSIYRVMAADAAHGGELIGRYEPLTKEYLAWAVRRDDTALRDRLDAVLATWNADGTLVRVLGKWIEVQSPPAPAQ